MADLKGTKTEQNLLKAFAGESQARNRYTFYAKTAKKEGYEQIAAIFAETAANEEQHAKMFFKLPRGPHGRDHRDIPGRQPRTARPPRTSTLPPTARTRSGPTCTRRSRTSRTSEGFPDDRQALPHHRQGRAAP